MWEFYRPHPPTPRRVSTPQALLQLPQSAKPSVLRENVKPSVRTKHDKTTVLYIVLSP